MIDGPAPNVHIVPMGDAAILVEFHERVDPGVNARVTALWRRLRERPFPGVRDVVPSYASLGVYFDPLRTDVPGLVATLERAAAEAEPATVVDRPPLQIPVCYGGEFGPDLEAVAARGGLTVEEAVSAHVAPMYRVYMLGFSPGFAYMAAVDPRLAAPRRATPRVKVPAGSVGIAGRQTGIYPSDTPGGWMLVGRTPVRPFEIGREPPFLFQPGDTVQFHSIDADQFRRMEAAGHTGV